MIPISRIQVLAISALAVLGTSIVLCGLADETYAQSSETLIVQRRVPPPQRVQPQRPPRASLPALPPAPAIITGGKQDGACGNRSADPQISLERGRILAMRGAVETARNEFWLAAEAFRCDGNTVAYQQVVSEINSLGN